jgi:hypothetical protein
MIERYNVLELLGADKNKYHSCIITCFSFDFLFFEQRVLPKLRHAGIININLFVDARMFQQQLVALESNYRNNKSYSIVPIELNGAFHPKIIMAFGKNNGFLAIGSGNLTNSGLSSNDEVWGAFHTYKTESKATPLFKTVYSYLNQLDRFCYGINKTKWDWVLKNTSWLQELVENNETKSVLSSKEESIQVIASFADISIYKQLIESLPNEPLEDLVIISPYFNKKGQVIENLITDLKPNKVKVVVDSRFGTVPFQFNNTNKAQFFDWNKVASISKDESPRLHAKIIQFKFKTKTAILIGSANATIEALGTNTNQTKNAEMSLLISSNSKKDWLEEMKIELPERGDFILDNYTPKTIENTIGDSKHNVIKINHAELDYTALKVYGANFENISKTDNLVVVKKNDLLVRIPLDLDIIDNNFSIQLTEESINGAYKLYIENAECKKQSNIAFLHFYQSIIKTNPDEKSLRFLELINSEALPDNDLIELLEYATFEKDKIIYNASGNSPLSIKETQDESEKEYDVVDEKEFNRNEEIVDSTASNNNNHLTLLEEFLDHMTFGGSNTEDFTDSDERAIEDARETGIEDKDLTLEVKEKLSYADGNTLKNKLHNTLKAINGALEEKHKSKLKLLLENKSFSNPEILNDLKSVLIGLHLIIMKKNHSFEEEKVQFKVIFKAPKDLVDFENEKGFNISRVRPQVNVAKNEILYCSDVNILSNIDDLMSKHKDIELSYIDETPSIKIDHKYYENNPIISSKKQSLDSIKGFLINTVSPLLLLLLNDKNELNIENQIKFDTYKKRLFYRVLLVFNLASWSNKEKSISQLFLLNLFETALPVNSGLQEVNEQLETFRNKLSEHFELNKNTYSFFENNLESYLNWKEVFIKNKPALITILNRSYVGRITYKNKFGFCRISTVYDGQLNVETPLGYFNDDSLNYQIKRITGGTKAIIY